MTGRLRVRPDGSLLLPEELRESLGWKTGSYVEFHLGNQELKLRRIEIDPFAEAAKEPDPDAFDKVLKRQEESRDKAFEDFEERMKEPPEVKPEDRPDFWR